MMRQVATVLVVSGVLGLVGVAAAAPQVPRGVLLEARAALAEGRFDDALVELGTIAAQYPGSSFVALWYGHAWWAKGDRSAATAEYLRGLELQPDSAPLLIAVGDVHYEIGNLTLATEYYERAITVAPRLPIAHRKAAAAEIQRVRYREAIAHLQAYLELQGDDDIEALNILGIHQYIVEDHDGSIATLERVLQIDPDNGKAHFGLGMALSGRSAEYDRSLFHLRRAILLDPTNPTAHFLAGRILTAQDRLEEALEALQRSLELSPDLTDTAKVAMIEGVRSAHYRISLVYARIGDRDAAHDHQQRFQELTRTQADLEAQAARIGALRDAATAALATNNAQEFRDAVAELLLAAPDNPGALTLSARGSLAAGDLDCGLAAAERALEIAPDQWEPLYVYGMLLYESDRYDEARESLARALRANPVSASAHGALGAVLVAMGESREALAQYRAAIRLDPEQAVHYLNLATAYQKLGESELEAQAMEAYRRLLRRHP
ncbi:MAG: tetratricopeptide repeat protein [Acidobacteria bacterium]|nr:tetratricopeptide repeat protein [Acidobacteriota bacterium]